MPIQYIDDCKNLDEIKQFVKKNDIDSINESDVQSCLENACLEGDFEIIEYLVTTFDYIQDCYSVSKNGSLHNACIKNNLKLINYLIDNFHKEQWHNVGAFEIACIHNCVKIPEMLVKKFGKDVLDWNDCINVASEYECHNIHKFLCDISIQPLTLNDCEL